jgi:hypothetical protein
MIDTSNATVHAVSLTSAQINVLVEALADYAQQHRTPELNVLMDALDSRINSDLREDA